MLEYEDEGEELGNNEKLNDNILDQIEDLEYAQSDFPQINQESADQKIHFKEIVPPNSNVSAQREQDSVDKISKDQGVKNNLLVRSETDLPIDVSKSEKSVETEQEDKDQENEMILNRSLLKNRKSKETDSENFSNPKMTIPNFVEGETNFAKNHVCRKLNRFRCDNSQNYITQCTESFLTRQNIRELLLDCRKTISHFTFERFLGPESLELSSFGPRSKCVRVKAAKQRSTATCMETYCHTGGTSYSVMFPYRKSNAISGL